jgi:acyl carrier protein
MTSDVPGELKRRLSQLWESVLGTEHITSDDNFFMIGGDSLSALELCTVINETFKTEIGLTALYRYQTVTEIAALIAELADTASPDPMESFVSTRSRASLSWQQEVRLRRHDNRTAAVYNQATLFSLPNSLSTNDVLERFRAITAQHDVLRVIEISLADGGYAVYSEVVEPPVSFASTGSEDEMAELIEQFSSCPFDLPENLLWRAAVIDHPDSAGRPAISVLALFNHLISDARSLTIFERYVTGMEASALPQPGPQYREWVEWQRRHFPLADSPSSNDGSPMHNFWRRHLGGTRADRPVELPFCRHSTDPLSGTNQLIVMDLQTSAEQLRVAAGRSRSSPFLLTIASVIASVAEAGSTTDVTIKVVSSGRLPMYRHTLGFFADFVPLRVRHPALYRAGNALTASAAAWLDTLDFQAAPWEYILTRCAPTGTPAHVPSAQVQFNFVPHDNSKLWERVTTGSSTQPGLAAGLHVIVFPGSPGKYRLACRFDPVRFASDDVRNFLGRIVAKLSDLVGEG